MVGPPLEKREASYDTETVPVKVQTRIETRFRFRILKPEFPGSGFRIPVSGFLFRFRLGVPCCRSLPARSLPWRLPVSGFRFPVSAGGLLLPLLALAASGFRPHFSLFFLMFSHFPHFHSFFLILPHFSPFFIFPFFPSFLYFSSTFLIFAIFHIFLYFSSCFTIFPHFPHFLHFSTFFIIFPHFSPFPQQQRNKSSSTGAKEAAKQ